MQDSSPYNGGSAGGAAGQGRVLATIASLVSRWSVLLSLAILPLVYCAGTVDTLDLPKQGVLMALTVSATLAWIGKMIVERRAEFRRSAVHLLVAVWLVIYALATWFSQNRYMSLVGDDSQQKAGLVTVVCFVLLYFVAVHVLRGAKDVKTAMWALGAGTGLSVLLAFLQAFGVRLLPGAPVNPAFNTVGTSNALALLAAAVTAMAMGALLEQEKTKIGGARQITLAVAAVLGVVFLAMQSFWALWATLLVGSAAIVLYGMIKTDRVQRVTMLALPMAAIVLAVLFSIIRFPINLGLPAEVMPSMSASWSISREALASSPLFGSGPGTFLYDYTRFHAKDLNRTLFWNVQFDRSASRFLTELATIGILGLAATVVLVVFVALLVAVRLAKGQEDWVTTLSVYAAWLTLLAGKALYSSNMTLEFVFWMLTAMLVVLEWRKGQEVRFDNSPRAALLSSFFFIVAVILSISGLYLAGQRYVAERHYAAGAMTALDSEENLNKATEHLVRATQLNPKRDLFYRTLAQALALQATAAARNAGGRPDEETSRRIVTLAASAVNAGKRATEIAPKDVRNWSTLAGLYRDLGPATPGAFDAAIEAYTRSIELEPSNPVYPTELGKLQLTIGDVATAALDKDATAAEKAAAKTKAEEQQQKAREQFDLSVALKEDYAPAHYWIAMVLEQQGKTKEALAKLESVRNYNPRDLGVGFQLAILYYQSDERPKAITELERIIKENPQYANARWYLSAMYEESGRLDDAIVQIDEVLKTNPENQDVQKRLEDLKAKKSGTAVPETEGLPEPADPPVQP